MKSFIPRTLTCGELRQEHVGKKVVLAGWVHRVRNLGAMVFVDLRDRYGTSQVIFDLRFTSKEVYEAAKKLASEFVVEVEGEVVLRESPNPKIATGLVEVRAEKLLTLSEADVLPFSVADDTIEPHEDLRLKYRYLDMRKGKIISNLILRHQAMQATRAALTREGFTEVSTPILCKSTPEGARDYLVPSRVHHGDFFALPQSPQMFKQLLMVGGLDKYFQIATCFRDEDLRADRQPEFQQIDIEMSFGTAEQLFPVIEQLVQMIFVECRGVVLPQRFRRMTYQECMERYGTDKPDLRFEMPLADATDIAARSSSTILEQIVRDQGIVKGLTLKKGADLSRKQLEEYQSLVAQFGFKGLFWLKRTAEGLQGSLAKFIDSKDQVHWIERFGMETGDLSFVLAGPRKKVHTALDQLRRRLGKDANLIDTSRFEPLWVVDFPLFSWNDEEQKIESEHNPFTSPHLSDLDLLETNPLATRSSSYDLVINGYELASGAQRIHSSILQEKIFRTIGLSDNECREKFGFFVEALIYGTPPHLGIALGFDRLVMILLGTENIRDVVAFPKNQKAQDLMMSAPSDVTSDQLRELGIKLDS